MKKSEKSVEPLTPFHDSFNKLHFKYRPLRDICFIWQVEPPKTLGKLGIIEMATQFIRNHKKGEGILLAVGPGYHSQDGKFHPTSDQLRVGLKVQYDQSVPWSAPIEDLEGELRTVTMCTTSDLRMVIG